MSQTMSSIDEFEASKKELLVIVNETVKENNLPLTTHFIQNLSVHLAIALLRIKSNNYIPLSQGQIASYKDNENFKIATTLCKKLEKKYHVEFPESEQALISMYLSKINMLDVEFNSGFDLLDSDILIIIQNTINTIYIKTGIDLRDDEKLLIALGLHLTPAINRLIADDQVDNPLLDKIKERYKQAYEMAQILNDIIEDIYKKSFTDDEAAYFALHFAVSMKHTKKSSK